MVQVHPIYGADAPNIRCKRTQYTVLMHGIYLLIAGYEGLKIKHLSFRLRPIYLAFATYIGRECEVYTSQMRGILVAKAPSKGRLGKD